MKKLCACLLLLVFCSSAWAQDKHPPCDGPENWAAAMAGVYLKNKGLTQTAGGFDSVLVNRLASEPLGKDLFNQVHTVLIQQGEKTFTLITVNTASFEECSVSEVDVYLVQPLN